MFIDDRVLRDDEDGEDSTGVEEEDILDDEVQGDMSEEDEDAQE